MDIFQVVGLGIVATVLAVVLKQYRPEYRIFISLAAGTLLFIYVLNQFIPVLEDLNGIMAGAALPEGYLTVLIKALGICFVCQIACDCCKDAGESSLSSKIEMAGKVAILTMALPFLKNLLSIAAELMRF